MSALITSIIPAQRFETIRDKIAEILALELLNQQTLIVADEGEFVAPTVWTDRYVTFDKTELPALVVSLGTGEYSNQNPISAEGVYSYFIDVYANAESEEDVDGYKLSNAKMARIMGMVRYILSSPFYQVLGLARGYILNRTIQSLGVFTAKDVQDALSDAVGRMVLTVRAVETQDGQPTITLEGMDTIFMIEETDRGNRLISNYE